MTADTDLRSVEISGPCGILEAMLHHPGGPETRGLAVVAHPHPLYGGTMRNAVVEVATRTLAVHGFLTLRFNFRGVGRSAGQHDEGHGEQLDLFAADRWLRSRESRIETSSADDPGVLWVGYSFGAAVALQCLRRCFDRELGGAATGAQPPPQELANPGAGSAREHIAPRAVLLLAPPLSMRDFSFLEAPRGANSDPQTTDRVPLALITGQRDELTPPELLARAVRWAGLRHHESLEDAGHDLRAHEPSHLDSAIERCLTRLDLL